MRLNHGMRHQATTHRLDFFGRRPSLFWQGETQVEPSCDCSDGVFAAGVSFGSLKYEHHFGLDCFSIRGEHWTLQA
jgi:hypothetical protein